MMDVLLTISYVLAVLLAIVIVIIWFNKQMSPIYKSNVRLDGKTVIVTGANTGIGKVTAEELAKRGARVILACRNMTKANQAADEIRSRLEDGRNVKVMQLDLGSLQSVRDFSRTFLKEEDRLDILLNNAGVGCVPNRTITEDGIETTMASNHFGHFLLTNLLLDKLKTCSPSRIVNVSSVAHVFGKLDFDNLMGGKKYSRIKAYCDSKLCNIYFTRELARKLQGTGVTANALHPGTINSEFGRHVWMTHIPGLCHLIQLLTKTTYQGAQTSIYCCIAEELETVSGKYYDSCREGAPSQQAHNDEVAGTLWHLSERLCGLK